jgi:AcrR family transcriptional regulator
MTRPTGRDEVRRAVLEAAVRLFVARGPAAVSLRDIATEADVNLGLLYRHFGTKVELISAAMDLLVSQNSGPFIDCLLAPDMPAEFAKIVTSGRTGDAPMQPYVRMMAWMLLDGVKPGDVQSEYPVFPYLVKRLISDGRSLDDARMTAVVVFATALGWLIFEPFINQAAQLDDVPIEDVRKALADAFGRLIE